MELEPIESASEQNNYQGNANLGFGADGNSLNPGVQDYTTVVNNALNAATQRNFQWRVQKFNQQIEDRDATRALFAQAKIQGTIDEADKPELDRLYDEMKDLYVKNPNLTGRAEAFAEMQSKVQKFNQLSTQANSRDLEFKKQRLAIADERDPQKRNAMIAHLEAEKAKGINHTPVPYFKDLDWDPKVVNPEWQLETVGTDTKPGPDGLMRTTKTSKTNLKRMIEYWNPQSWLQGGDNTNPDQLAEYTKYILQDPSLTSPENLAAANKKLDELNKANGFQPGSPYYLTPVAVEDKASGTWKVENNPIELAKKMNILAKYKEQVGPAELDKAAQEQRTELSQQKSYDASAARSYADANRTNKLLPYEIETEKEKARKAKIDGNMAEYDLRTKTATASKPVVDAVNVFDAVDNSTSYKAANQFLSGNVPAGDKATLSNLTANNPNLQITQIGADVPGARKMLSTKPAGKNTVLTAPERMYAIKDPNDPDNTIIVGVDKNGKLTKSSNLGQGINDLISFETNLDAGKERVELGSAAQVYLQELQGDDGVNASLTKIRGRINNGGAAAQPSAPSTNISTGNNQPAADGGGVSVRLSNDPSKFRVRPGTTNVVEYNDNGKWRRVLKKNSKASSMTLE